MSFWAYLKKSLLLLSLCLLIGGAAFARWNSEEIRNAIVLGVAIAYANAVVGFVFLNWGIKQSQHIFFLSIYGGMIFRFLLIFSLLFILIGALQINQVALVLSLIAAYFLFLALEIYQVYKFSHTRKES